MTHIIESPRLYDISTEIANEREKKYMWYLFQRPLFMIRSYFVICFVKKLFYDSIHNNVLTL